MRNKKLLNIFIIILFVCVATFNVLAISQDFFVSKIYISNLDLSSVPENKGNEIRIIYLYYSSPTEGYILYEPQKEINKSNTEHFYYEIKENDLILDFPYVWGHPKGKLRILENGKSLFAENTNDSYFRRPTSVELVFNLSKSEEFNKNFIDSMMKFINDSTEEDEEDEENMEEVTENLGEIFTAVEQKAEFPGGQAALMKFITNNLRYPNSAMENNIEGRVLVKLLIEQDGTISNALIERSINSDLDKEALRIVQKMPQWQPAMNNGIPVRSYFMLPVTFKLSK